MRNTECAFDHTCRTDDVTIDLALRAGGGVRPKQTHVSDSANLVGATFFVPDLMMLKPRLILFIV